MNSDPGITNVRNVKSPHWRRWLGIENRCVVPFTSFSENKHLPDGTRPPVWFALDETRSLAFFAGIWTRWTWVRKVKEGETTKRPLRVSDDRCKPGGRRRSFARQCPSLSRRLRRSTPGRKLQSGQRSNFSDRLPTAHSSSLTEEKSRTKAVLQLKRRRADVVCVVGKRPRKKRGLNIFSTREYPQRARHHKPARTTFGCS